MREICYPRQPFAQVGLYLSCILLALLNEDFPCILARAGHVKSFLPITNSSVKRYRYRSLPISNESRPLHCLGWPGLLTKRFLLSAETPHGHSIVCRRKSTPFYHIVVGRKLIELNFRPLSVYRANEVCWSISFRDLGAAPCWRTSCVPLTTSETLSFRDRAVPRFRGASPFCIDSNATQFPRSAEPLFNHYRYEACAASSPV